MKPFLSLILLPITLALVSTDLPSTKGTYSQCEQDTTVNNLAIQVHLKYDSLLEVSHKEKILVGIKDNGAKDYVYYKLDFYDYTSADIIICRETDCQLIFANKGFITKRININGTSVPDSLWEGGFIFDMDVKMVQKPENFNDSLTLIPLGIASWNETEQSLSFDSTYTRIRNEALVLELERASAFKK